MTEGGPASRAGLSAEGKDKLFNGTPVHLGDQVVEIGGRKVTSTDDLMRYAALLHVGEAVDITFYRGGKSQTVQVIPAPRAIT